jgi:hypothetical protein
MDAELTLGSKSTRLSLLMKTVTGAGKYAGQPLKTKFASKAQGLANFACA